MLSLEGKQFVANCIDGMLNEGAFTETDLPMIAEVIEELDLPLNYESFKKEIE